jgi:hypothetical protein
LLNAVGDYSTAAAPAAAVAAAPLVALTDAEVVYAGGMVLDESFDMAGLLRL